MFISVLLAAVGVVGAAYALGVSMLGLVHGPLCRVRLQNGTLSDWERPFLISHKLRSVSRGGGAVAGAEAGGCREGEGAASSLVILELLSWGGKEVLWLCSLTMFSAPDSRCIFFEGRPL